MKPLLFAAATLIATTALIGPATHTAQAGNLKWCEYAAIDVNGKRVSANAERQRKSKACKVAKRRCVRRLKRKQRKGKFGRSHGCHEVRVVTG